MASELSRDKIKGMFLGVAIGDALFMPVEIWPAERIAEKYGRITYYRRPDGHPWFDGRPAGMWTDDTQLTLVVAESLIARKKIDINDLARRHIAAMEEAGDKGWGGSTREAVQRIKGGMNWFYSGKHDNPKRGCGNGMAMKISPIGAFWAAREALSGSSIRLDLRESGEILWIACMTHKTAMAYESAMIHVLAVRYCLERQPDDFSKNGFLQALLMVRLFANHQYRFNILPTKEQGKLTERLGDLAKIDYAQINGPEISERFGNGSCYVYNSLPFSYAFFLKNPRSIETLYDVGNAGGDTDTNASIVGGLLGALNGSAIFPEHLVNGLWQKEKILDTAERFCDTFGVK